MPQLLNGLGFKGYRSYYGDYQYFGPLRKVNLLAGQNNAGKSNVLKFIVDHLQHMPNWRPDGLDVPRNPTVSSDFGYAMCLPESDEILSLMPGMGNLDDASKRQLSFLIDNTLVIDGVEGRWVRYAYGEQGRPMYLADDADRIMGFDMTHDHVLPRVRMAINSTSGGPKYADVTDVLDAIVRAFRVPPVKVINSFRQISKALGDENDGLAGRGLIDSLAELQNPEAIDQQDAERKYSALNDFVSSVFDQRGVSLEIPASRKTINIRARNNVLLPLENQGTGIHQVIIIAAMATMVDNTLVCIEEPEVNLHPILQRRLVKYLYESTNNQYVITTHSAQMLDYSRGNVFHLSMTEAGTQITPATTPAHVAQVCSDLGYRPSDLIQANAIIWVEGPSDRTYINHWIREIDDNLEEGIHYSIMFYGGGLLSELTADDPTVTEFIKLRRLNRNVAIVIDSDRTPERKSISPTKQRVEREISDSSENSLVWVTDGYTIENYVPPELLRAAALKVHPRKAKQSAVSSDPLVNPLAGVISPDKSAIAKEVVSTWSPSLADKDLRRQVTALVSFIHRANVGMFPLTSVTATDA